MVIPVYQPDLSGNEKKYVDDCMDSTWISSKGKYVELFEKAFAKYIGCDYSIAVNNGTIALQLGLIMLGISTGDEVIVPTFTYIATVNAITYLGAKPVFVDSLESTWQIDPKDIREKITKRTKAVVAVHLYGHPCEMDEIKAICKKYNLYLVEDCAEAIGTEYHGKKVGSFGDVACFSFFGNKTITTGEGGMVLTNSKSLYEYGRRLKNQGITEGYEYWHDIIGYNFRMTNIAAAIGYAQLERIEYFIEQKKRVSDEYKKKLCGLPIRFHEEIGDVRHTYWMNCVLTQSEEERRKLAEYLEKYGIETRPTFYPVHFFPMYLEKNEYPVAEKIGLCGINLPSWPGLTSDEIDYICKHIRLFYEECKSE